MRAGRPAIGKGEAVELVKEPRRGRGRESHDGQYPQMRVAEHGLKTAGQRLVGQKRVEIHRHLGHADALAVGRDAGVQVGQRLRIIEPPALRHEAFDELQDAIGAIDEAAQDFARVGVLRALASLVEQALGPCGILRRRQIQEGQEVARFVMGPLLLEFGPALGIDQRRGRVRESVEMG